MCSILLRSTEQARSCVLKQVAEFTAHTTRVLHLTQSTAHESLIKSHQPVSSQVAEFTGHTARVLHLAQSPDGSTVCSAAADETLHFWKCFGEAPTATKVRAQRRLFSSLCLSNRAS